MRFTRSALFAMALVITVPWSETPAAAQLNILWDDSHDGDVGDDLTMDYSDFAAAVEALGHTIDQLDGFPGAITADALAGYQVLMLFDLDFPFVEDQLIDGELVNELDVIHTFVANGGMVFVVGESPGNGTSMPPGYAIDSHNALLAPYGLEFTAAPAGTVVSSSDMTLYATHPITAGLGTMDLLSAGAITITDANLAQALGRISAADPRITLASSAQDRVVVIGDSNPFDNLRMVPGDVEHLFVANLLGHFQSLAGGGGQQPIEITIDLRPGDDANEVNPGSKGLLTVAILTTSATDGAGAIDFDPWDVLDVETIAFGPGEASYVHAQPHAEDADGDGDLDMVVHFRTQETGVTCGDTELTLTGETFDDQTVTATDAVATTGCE